MSLNTSHDQSREHGYAPNLVSASARSPDDLNPELGFAVTVPVNHRMSATEHDLRGCGRSPSAAGTGTVGIRLPFQKDRGRGEDDAVSVVSDLNGHQDGNHDFHDLSSVSSNDDHGYDHQDHTVR